MNAGLPHLTQANIRDWVGSASLNKGQAYFHQGRIVDPRRRGMTLKAKCLGTSFPSYRVEVHLSPERIESAFCSCPVGGGGYCKHVAALLLTWLEDSDAFREIEDLNTALEGRSKTELIALIHEMLRREPELEILLELPIPTGEGGQEPLDPDLIRRQAEHAFHGPDAEWGWGDLYGIARELESLQDIRIQIIPITL